MLSLTLLCPQADVPDPMQLVTHEEIHASNGFTVFAVVMGNASVSISKFGILGLEPLPSP